MHIAIADTIRVSLAPGVLWTHFPAGELRPDKTGALLQRMGVQQGWPDFLFVLPPAGQLHALELKRRGKRPTEGQLAFLEALTLAGGQACWVDSYEAAIAILQRWGVLSTRLKVQ